MVSLTQGDKVFGEQKLRVAASSGEYADVDLIECSDSAGVEPTVAFQAQYVKYGPMVYQFSTPEELGAAIIALDSESSHDAAQLWREDEARRRARMGGTLTPEDPTPAPDALEPKAPVEEPKKEETPQEEPVQDQPDEIEFVDTPSTDTSTTTPETPTEPLVPEIPIIEMEEPPIGEVEGMTTTTPPTLEPLPEVIIPEEPEEFVIEDIPPPTSTTTPE